MLPLRSIVVNEVSRNNGSDGVCDEHDDADDVLHHA